MNDLNEEVAAQPFFMVLESPWEMKELETVFKEKIIRWKHPSSLMAYWDLKQLAEGLEKQLFGQMVEGSDESTS